MSWIWESLKDSGGHVAERAHCKGNLRAQMRVLCLRKGVPAPGDVMCECQVASVMSDSV